MPNAPTALSASALSSSQIELNWNDSSADESSFTIERSLDSTDWTPVNTLAADSQNYSDTHLAANTLFYYRVYASNGAGNSVLSNIASDSTLPASEFNLAATSYKTKGIKHIELYWQQSETVDIVFDGELTTSNTGVTGTDVGAQYYFDLNTGIKGGSSHTVQVCVDGDCSAMITVIF